ncbi:unnamed protein product [Cylicocyclus nassatus]|uniref:Uncharacterized protein n=1 Tax=Cylicocyclus nassatus TaxID=53992 RepID=A0AA36H9S3_CYLNA|nr:unnamed protein product [Cylicocyclus nassatus]
MDSHNPYTHTSFVQNPKAGRKLYEDEVHQDMKGISNLFTPTPTINKYAHSVDSIADITKLPAIARSPTPFGRNLQPGSSSTRSDYETINKRKLTNDSLFELQQIPCPFSGKKQEQEKEIGKKKRREFSEDSRIELSKIPDVFQLEEERSNYFFDRSIPAQLQSHYAYDRPAYNPSMAYLHPYPDQKTINKYARSVQSQIDLQQIPAIQATSPTSSYSHRSPSRHTPTHSAYDYTAYYHGMPPQPPVYMPPPYLSPYGFYPPPYLYYPYQYPPMYHLGPPIYPYHPGPPYSPQPQSLNDLSTDREHGRIPDLFSDTGSNLAYPLRTPIIPDNETINKYLRGAESITDLHNIDVQFEPKQLTPAAVTPEAYRLRDFSVDSIKDLNALPSISKMSLYNTPTKNVSTAKSISESEPATKPVRATAKSL